MGCVPVNDLHVHCSQQLSFYLSTSLNEDKYLSLTLKKKSEVEGQVVVIGQREGERCAQAEIGGEKCRIGAVVIVDLGADIGDIPTPRPLALVTAYDGVGGVVARDVGRESRCSGGLFGLRTSESEIGVYVPEHYAH